MGQQQPALVELDRRPAIADLHELPRELRLQDRNAAIPGMQVGRIDEIEVLVVLPADHGVLAVDLPGEQGHALVPCGGSPQGRHAKGYEIGGLDQLGSYRGAAIGGVCRVEGLSPAVFEFHETGIFDPVRLGQGDGKDHPLADILVRPEHHFDIVPIRTRYPIFHSRNRRKTRGRIDRHAAVSGDASRSKRQGGNMPFPDRAKTEDEATSAFRRAGLIRMGDDARIEQCRRFEGILMQEIGSDQLTLRLGENRMRREGDFHFVGARLEGRQQVAMAALEILQHIGQVMGCHLGIRAPGPARRYGSRASCRWV